MFGGSTQEGGPGRYIHVLPVPAEKKIYKKRHCANLNRSALCLLSEVSNHADGLNLISKATPNKETETVWDCTVTHTGGGERNLRECRRRLVGLTMQVEPLTLHCALI